MILIWTHDKETGTLNCVINDNLRYTAYNGGSVIHKMFNNERTILEHQPQSDPWEDEKHWLSENYSDTVGVYEPFYLDDHLQDDWIAEHDWQEAFPMFGVSDTGSYLDRLQRPSEAQTGVDMETVIYNKEQKIFIERDSDGNYFKREWCDYQNDFYNVQPCCVFPDNPGRTPLTAEEVSNYQT